jgi:hypothetical protein
MKALYKIFFTSIIMFVTGILLFVCGIISVSSHIPNPSTLLATDLSYAILVIGLIGIVTVWLPWKKIIFSTFRASN